MIHALILAGLVIGSRLPVRIIAIRGIEYRKTSFFEILGGHLCDWQTPQATELNRLGHVSFQNECHLVSVDLE